MYKKFLIVIIITGTSILNVFSGNYLPFIENNGQWSEQILFKATVMDGNLFLEKNAFTWYFSNATQLLNADHSLSQSNPIIKKHAFKIFFDNSNPDVFVSGNNVRPEYYNFFQGNNPDEWQGEVPAYNSVIYKNLYNGIDLEVYSEAGNLKYDFIIHPGANPEQIKIRYEGLDSIQLRSTKLYLYNSVNTLVEQTPYTYSNSEKIKQTIPCNYILKNNTVQFHFPEGYNTMETIVIDPTTLIFSSYSGSTADNWGYSATYDDDGNLYGAGIVFDDGYPVTLGAFEETFQGGFSFFPCDVAISKFNAIGTDLIYSTYLGGSQNELPHSLVVDDNNELVVFGTTGSDDFPVTADAYDNTFNGGYNDTVTYVIYFPLGVDAFVTKFNVDGSALIGSTYLGGSGNDGQNSGSTAFNYGDHSRGEVVTDNDMNCYIASSTTSSDFPTTAGVFQSAIAGNQDGFVAKFNADLTALIWCSYIGGAADDGPYSMKLAPDETILISGGTGSTDLPTTADALQETFQGGSMDGFVARINNDATAILNATYIGTDNYDQIFLLDKDDENNVYIVGQTSGAYPVTASVYSNPGSSQFITKLNSDLSEIIFSTVFGSGSSIVNISPTAFLVDECYQLYVSGWGGTVNSSFNPLTGNVLGMPITDDAYDAVSNGSDFYFIVLGNDADELIYATYFGSPSAADHVDGGTSRFDKKGIIYQAVCAGCGGFDDFPTTDDAWSTTNNSFNCNLGVFKFEFSFTGPSASISAIPLSGCAPSTVIFSNTSTQTENFLWDFGDGSTSTESEPNHVYETPGTYFITLIAIDSDACIPNDTAYLTINVFDLPEAGFSFTPDSVSVFGFANFIDQSTNASSWYWTFGDGTNSTLQNPTHAYPAAGNYTVCQTVTNADGCTDSICKQIEVFEISILDVPNAFSPNGDGFNDIFLPVNYGLSDFEFRIYNRWGQLVFQSNDSSIGWDGYFNGVEQEVGTYAYVVSGKGKDNAEYYRQGNLTLVR
ncbi:MAG: gliding motility-associated C-terminal domain-containing protein [Chitinophagales bacterium]|nr:gliding motility-associated C-terminal domain-containing protein [Chitinophagales bacterium]